jgi:hypothetical protein
MLAGCADADFYADHRDGVTFHSGNAVASNIAVQTNDPWPPAASDRNIPGNGPRTQKAIERYRTGKVIAPQGVGTTSVQGQQSTQPDSGVASPTSQ